MHPVQSNRQAPYNTKGQKGLSLAKYIKKKKKGKKWNYTKWQKNHDVDV